MNKGVTFLKVQSRPNCFKYESLLADCNISLQSPSKRERKID